MAKRHKIEAADRKEAQVAWWASEQTFDRERRGWAVLSLAAVNLFLMAVLNTTEAKIKAFIEKH